MEEKSEAPETPQPEAEKPAEPPHKRVLPLHLLGSPVLRRNCVLVEEITDDLRALSDLMVHTMFHVNGIGLAAPQIGIPLRIFVMQHQAERRVLRLCNPEINATEGEQELDEGCLSQPGLNVHTKRPKYLAVRALDIETGNVVIVEGTDLEAACLSHEIDHLNGKLICDYLSQLKRDMYKKKLQKYMKRHDRAEAARAAVLAQVKEDHRDHPHFTESK
jgi:peptide deformylase